MNIKELKNEFKFIKAVRIDKNFISNDERIEQYIKAYENKGFILKNETLKDNEIELEFFNKNYPQNHKFYYGNNQDNITKSKQRLVDQGFTITDERILDKDVIIFTTKEYSEKITVYLQKNYFDKAEIQGIIYFRSKDFYFQFKDDNGNIHNVYSEKLTSKNFITDGIIKSGNYEYQLIF